jgi:hypothetical protein
MVGESAAQPGFATSIRILVSSNTQENARSGLSNLLAATSIFTDEYSNNLDNPQVVEDGLAFFFTPLRYFAYRFRLMGLLQSVSRFSCDELATMFHFPDIQYNKSPIIAWLDYKMLPPPANLKTPKDPTMLIDYIRDEKGNVITEDGSKLKVDKNWNLVRDEAKNFVLMDDTTVPVAQDGERKGRPLDPAKSPKQALQQRKIAGF